MHTVERPACLDALLPYVNYEGGRFLTSEAVKALSSDKDLFDRWLVSIGHPLAYEPGTQESRLVSVARSLANRGSIFPK